MASQSASVFKRAEQTSLSAALARMGGAMPNLTAAKAHMESRPVTSCTTHVSVLVDAIRTQLYYLLSAADQDDWSQIISSLPHAVTNVLDMFCDGSKEVIEKTIEAQFSGERQRWLLAQATRFSSLSQALKADPSLRPWIDIRAFDNALHRQTAIKGKDMSENDRETLRFLRGIEEKGILRKPCPIPGPELFLTSIEQFPNFAEALRYLAEQVALARLRGEKSYRGAPILLLGPAGVGKSYFANAIARKFGTSVEILSLASQSCGFTLAGLDRGWGTAKPGLVFTSLLHGQTLSPVLMLDEIDKVSDDAKSNPLGSLYTLLETSSNFFRDEYVEIAIDASHVIWMATANDVDKIPQPILSRFKVFNISLPTPEQTSQIAEAVYAELAAGLAGAPATMPAKWREQVAAQGQSIRDIRKSLQDKLGAHALWAVSQNKDHIELDVELGLPQAVKSSERITRIGFV